MHCGVQGPKVQERVPLGAKALRVFSPLECVERSLSNCVLSCEPKIVCQLPLLELEECILMQKEYFVFLR